MKKFGNVKETVEINRIKKSRIPTHKCPPENQLKFERLVALLGQLRYIIVDQNYVILDGNRLYDAMLVAGASHVDVLKVTSPENARIVLAVMNITSLDDSALPAAAYQALMNAPELLDLLCYDRKQLEEWIAEIEGLQFGHAA